MAAVGSYSSKNNPYLFENLNSSYAQYKGQELGALVATKSSQDGRNVEFYYDNHEGINIRIDEYYVKQEDLPENLKDIGSKEALLAYLENSYVKLKELSNGDKLVYVNPKILGGGLGDNKLNQPGHGVTYVVLRKGESVQKIELKLTDSNVNTIRFLIDDQGTTLRYQNTIFRSNESLAGADPKRIMSQLCIENGRLASDLRYWVAVDSNQGKVSCGFGEVCDVTTLCTMSIDKDKLKNIQNVEIKGEDVEGNDIENRGDRLLTLGLVKGGAVIVDDGKLVVSEDEIKTVNLPTPVKDLMIEMTAVEREIEGEYGRDIWDKIQSSLDNGILRKMVEDKKRSIQQSGGPIKQEQAYVRIGFGDNYRGGPGHRMVIELWPAGHESPVHQHSSSYSYIKIMRGEFVNINYPILSDCELGKTEISKKTLREGDRTWLSPEQNQVHKIENKTNKGVISFHGYRYGVRGNQELSGVFDLIDKDGKYQEGGAVISHWDVFAKSKNYPEGIRGFLKTIKEEIGTTSPSTTQPVQGDRIPPSSTYSSQPLLQQFQEIHIHLHSPAPYQGGPSQGAHYSRPPAPHVVTHSSSSSSSSAVDSPTPAASQVTVPEMAFGKAKWAKYFGDVGVEPPLPKDIDKILSAPCPFWPNKKVRETHLLMLIPSDVNGRIFNLDVLSEMINSPKVGNGTVYRIYTVKNVVGKKSFPSHWILMTKEVIPESTNRTYEKQKTMTKGYMLPTALEATTSILMNYVQGGEMLYPNRSPCVWTRCQEESGSGPVVVGGFSSKGIDISYCNYPRDPRSGIACVKNLD